MSQSDLDASSGRSLCHGCKGWGRVWRRTLYSWDDAEKCGCCNGAGRRSHQMSRDELLACLEQRRPNNWPANADK